MCGNGHTYFFVNMKVAYMSQKGERNDTNSKGNNNKIVIKKNDDDEKKKMMVAQNII